LGRKPKQVPSTQKKTIRQIEKNQRNHIEGMFRQGKVKYNLNKIMAKLSETKESLIAGIFFEMNILKLSKDFLYLFLIRLTNVFLQKKSYFQYSKLLMIRSI
jgi:IS5 family transposase